MEWETFKANKKKRPNLSLSRTRLKKQKLEDSSKKSCCDEMATTTTAVKQELMLAADPVNVKTEQSTQTILNVESATKNEKNATLSCQTSIESETLTDSSSLPLNFESIKLEENGLLSQQLTPEKEEEEVVVKSEPESTKEPWLPYQHFNNDSLKKEEEVEDKKKIKAEIKAEESKREEELSYITKPEQMVSYTDDMDTAPIALESSSEYHCPICNIRLASSNNLRQRHIDKCLDEQEEKEKERTNNNFEFNQCFICSKDLSRFSVEQREIHLNRCLDLKQAQEKRLKDSTFAGQTIPSIDSLEQCPICHSGFTKAQPLKIKVSHLKQCSRKNNISAEVLKQKCRWIEWGHLEQQQQQQLQQQQKQLSTNQGKSTHVPSHFYMTDTHNDDFGHVDDDFSQKVIIHRAVSNKKVERELDKQDEELQTALAMSFSLQEQKKKPSKKRQLIEPDSADIWTPEESKVNSLERLSQLALKKKPASIYGIRLNHPSRLQSHSGRISFWKLASLRQQRQQQQEAEAEEEAEEEEGLCYLSLFLRELYNKQINK